MNVTQGYRIPVYTGTAAEMAAYTTMATGEIWNTTDTLKVYQYSGAAWVDVLSGISQDFEYITKATIANDTTQTVSFASIATGYKSFLITAKLKAQGGNITQLLLRFNNDSGNNYDFTTGGEAAGAWSRGVATGTNGINMIGNISNFNDTKTAHLDIVITNHNTAVGYKTSSSHFSTNDASEHTIGIWNNAADEISRIDLVITTANRYFKTGDVISLWGLKE